MVLRCSLLGHDFGETEVEREREERGSEVVVTVEEYEECARCGTRNVISENTEVRSNPSATATSTPASPDEPEPDPDTGEPTATEEIGDHPAVDADEETVLEYESEVPTDDVGEPITDDGEILEDDPEPAEDDREPGEWPDSDDVGPPVGVENEPTAWPDADEEGERPAQPEADPSPGDAPAAEVDADDEVVDDAIVIEDDPVEEPAADATIVDDARGADATTGSGPGVATDPPSDDPASTGIASAGPAPNPGDGAALEDVPTEFYCPRCSFVAPGDRGSLRPGDICPECRRGYLGERER